MSDRLHKSILILGAGRSSSSLIQYLAKRSIASAWQMTVADQNVDLIKNKIVAYPHVKTAQITTDITQSLSILIPQHDLIISLLPPDLHIAVAKACLTYGKNMMTASYVSEAIQSLQEEAFKKNIFILMECGLDPGIDHMSAMKEINRIKSMGGKIRSFKSYTGGLVAPESDDNPWHYKVTWNPRNVVLAGQGTVKYLEDGIYKYIPYHQLFSRTEEIEVKGYGKFEAYANRDSLKYISMYELDQVNSFLRGTLRKAPYCKAWNLLVKMGLTEDGYGMDLQGKNYEDFISSFLPEGKGSVKKRTADYLNIPETSEEFKMIDWLGLFDKKSIGIANATPANVLQKVIEQKWMLKPEDKDMIVMQHIFDYELGNKNRRLISSLVVKGDDQVYTAMAKTVGLPLAMAAVLFLEGKYNPKGIIVPLKKDIYDPVLDMLEEEGIRFINEEFEL
jgi:saccharopine dehydrogenase-like NADP-dependent oxidoreductase